MLIGERAAGMGGAFTALTDDPAGSAFYNPAALSQLKGSSLSGAVNIYHKSENNFGAEDDLKSAALRVNQGNIEPLSASSGTVYTFGNFATALSIVFPDYNHYIGQVRTTDQVYSFLNEQDASLWIGGALAVNTSPTESMGLTIYYSSRSLSRSLFDQINTGVSATVINEEKAITNNSLIYQWGYFRRLNSNWTVGLSYRFTSLPVFNKGDYYRSEFSTGVAPVDPITEKKQPAHFFVPSRLNLGVGYEQAKKMAISFDASFYDGLDYDDFRTTGIERIRHRPLWNFSAGYEEYWRTWLVFRAGVFSNFSSRPEVLDNPTEKSGDHVNMWGFSTNFAVLTSDAARITLGGYYTGGSGHAAEQSGGSYIKIPLSRQIFSFVVGTSYHF